MKYSACCFFTDKYFLSLQGIPHFTKNSLTFIHTMKILLIQNIRRHHISHLCLMCNLIILKHCQSSTSSNTVHWLRRKFLPSLSSLYVLRWMYKWLNFHDICPWPLPHWFHSLIHLTHLLIIWLFFFKFFLFVFFSACLSLFSVFLVWSPVVDYGD